MIRFFLFKEEIYVMASFLNKWESVYDETELNVLSTFFTADMGYFYGMFMLYFESHIFAVTSKISTLLERSLD